MKFTARHQLTVALTGGILCGKSTALRAFASAGAYTLSCDELVREISARPAVQKRIAALFGTAEKGELARKVFASASARRKLENLLHPLAARELARRLKKDKSPVRVAEVPLLFEAGWQDAFDMTVCVCAPDKTLPARLKARGMKKTDFLKRCAAQLPPRTKAARADICLLNGASADALERKVQSLYRAFMKIYTVK